MRLVFKQDVQVSFVASGCCTESRQVFMPVNMTITLKATDEYTCEGKCEESILVKRVFDGLLVQVPEYLVEIVKEDFVKIGE